MSKLFIKRAETELTLHLTPEEAEALYIILMHVGGNGVTAAHHCIHPILNAFDEAGYPVRTEYDFPDLVNGDDHFMFAAGSHVKVKERARRRFA